MTEPKHVMKLHPFAEVAANAEARMKEGWDIYQQWNCAHCGEKQTMDEENKFFKLGKCEECGKETNIEKDGCNVMLVRGHLGQAIRSGEVKP